MNTLIFTCALVSLGSHLIILYLLLFPKRPETISRWLFGTTEMSYDCDHCGSPVHTKFTNTTDRMLEHTYCPCCGEPHRL